MMLFLNAQTSKSINVKIVSGLLSDPVELIEAIAGRRVMMVSTPEVARLYLTPLVRALEREGILFHTEILDLDEKSKAIESALDVCSLAARHSIDRKGVFLALGGGVCSDVVGFAASMYRRGISHIRIPTTLVGQVDAAIGLKCGVNFEGRKNNLGAFHPPEKVLVDHAFLATLPPEELRQGVAEMIKIAVVRDCQLFSLLEDCGPGLSRIGKLSVHSAAPEVIHRSIELMLEELEQNPFEDGGYERLVDFGHTFSPVIEGASGFSLSHGDAVAIDMAISCVIANKLGMLPRGEQDRVVDLLRQCDLPVAPGWIKVDLLLRGLETATLHRGNALNFPLPIRVGAARFLKQRDELPDRLLGQVWNELVSQTEKKKRKHIA
ncbi:MAG: sedoheptulose 7-phosphate cyclase [Saprospiraceae bacterium]|nr:sedoheptulose 7-phosphate cyclase [Saprospiraceae bacterium]